MRNDFPLDHGLGHGCTESDVSGPEQPELAEETIAEATAVGLREFLDDYAEELMPIIKEHAPKRLMVQLGWYMEKAVEKARRKAGM